MSLLDKSTTPPKILNFNSKDRVSGSNSSFTAENSLLIDYGFDSVVLLQASIPRSFYNIPTGFNTFQLREGVTTVTVSIPAGTYNRVNLQIVLQQRLNASSPNGWVYSVTYPNLASSADTYKYTFSVSGNTSQPQFIFGANSVYRQMGFDIATYTFTTNALTSANCINLASITRAFIKSNICVDAQDSILQEILNYGTFPMLSLCFFEQNISDLNSRTLDPTVFNYEFSLVDAFGNEIDLNGVPWSFSLVFYKRNNVHELQKDDLKITNDMRLLELQTKEDALDTIEEKISLGQPITGELVKFAEPLFPYGGLPEGLL